MAQPMLSFPMDTILAAGCERVPLNLFGHNPGLDSFLLSWRKVHESFPSAGFGTMIIDGHQYLPGTPGGSVPLNGPDSVEFVFELYPDPMAPGDTVTYQIVAFNPADSAATSVLLTAMIVCPTTTGIIDEPLTKEFSLSPNPASGQVQILAKAPAAGHRFEIYAITGHRVASMPSDGSIGPVDISRWPPGPYIVCLVDGFRILCRKTLIISP